MSYKYEDGYDGLGGVDNNPYEVTESEHYECPHNCRDMSTYNFFLYSLMLLALGFCIGITICIALVGGWAC